VALPAFKFEMETPLEERVARLEANVDHIQKDVSDVKIDIRRFNDKIDSVGQKLSAKIDSVKDSVTALAINMEKQFTHVEKSFAALNTARPLTVFGGCSCQRRCSASWLERSNGFEGQRWVWHQIRNRLGNGRPMTQSITFYNCRRS
jgi:hypothetical protein